MKKYSLVIFVYLFLFSQEKGFAASFQNGLRTIRSWTELYGTYFNFDYYKNLENQNVDLGDEKLIGYLDSLMTLDLDNSSRLNKYYGGTFSLSSPFSVSLVGLKVKSKNDMVPSVSVWAVVCDFKGNVIDSECLFNQGENRVYKASICSILGTEGRMLVQTLDETNHSEIKYLDWSNTYDDGTPSRYFHCYDSYWTEGTGGLMATKERLSMPLKDYLSSFGTLNLVRIDYLRTDERCPKIGSKEIEPEDNFLIQSVHSNTGIDYLILLERIDDANTQERIRIKIIGCDIYHLNFDKVVGESEPILTDDIRNFRIVFKRTRNKFKLEVKDNGLFSFRSFYKVEIDK